MYKTGFKAKVGMIKEQCTKLEKEVALLKGELVSADSKIVGAKRNHERLERIIQKNKDAYQNLMDEKCELAASLARLQDDLGSFEREKCESFLPLCLEEQVHNATRLWDSVYPTNKLTYGLSGEHMYGEPSFGTMARICHVISSELQRQGRPLQPGDVLLDWGAGAGKWLLFARDFLQSPDMFALGIEIEEQIFRICSKNIEVAQAQDVALRTKVLHSSAATFLSFCPARVVVNYDGGYQKKLDTPKGRIHQTVLRTAFVSPSVDVVVSTRLNLQTFEDYFSGHLLRLGHSRWKCLFLESQNFGGSNFNVNIWFRLSPMDVQGRSFLDPRIHAIFNTPAFLQHKFVRTARTVGRNQNDGLSGAGKQTSQTSKTLFIAFFFGAQQF
jgi:hypothetical protein